MLELRRREKEAGLEPDWEIDAFMRASTLANRSQHIMTDYMLRLLGLEVRLLASGGCMRAPSPGRGALPSPADVEDHETRLAHDHAAHMLPAGVHRLQVCADVPVGSAMVRGISGGQRKRTTIGAPPSGKHCRHSCLSLPGQTVTLGLLASSAPSGSCATSERVVCMAGEMVIGPKRTLFMDEISTGLDASTTLQIVRCMRNLVVLRQVSHGILHACPSSAARASIRRNPNLKSSLRHVMLAPFGLCIMTGLLERGLADRLLLPCAVYNHDGAAAACA